MRSLFLCVAAAIGLTTVASAQQLAKLQVIHNAADKAAAVVDIYLGSELAVDDFAFQTATPFGDVPAGIPLRIGVAPGSSTSVSDTIASFTVTLEPDVTYIAVANGVLTPDAFAPNPAGASIGFKLFPIANARTEAAMATNVDILVFHGVTDAPAVDIYAGPNKVVGALDYGTASSYLPVPAGVYPIAVAPAGGSPIARYTADVTNLAGQSVTIVASGFLDAGANGGGSPFGLYAVTTEGGPFIPLPPQQNEPKARVQIVHNAADPAAAKVDIYVNGELAVDDFAFRAVTPTLELDPGKDYVIGVAPSTSTSVSDTLTSFTVSLPVGRYVVFANGLVLPGFAPNPSGASTAFTIFPITGIRPVAQSEGNIDFIVFHGVTDAPAVDVRVAGDNLVEGLAYGKHTEYLSVPAAEYVVGVAPAGGDVIASYRVPGTALAGQSAVIFASGFLNPAANMNGPAFGLYALIAGNVIALPVATASVNDVPELASAVVAPNPGSNQITARFTMPADGDVRVRVSSITGTSIMETTVTGLAAGLQALPLSVDAIAAGGYLLTLDAGTHRSVLPFTIVR